MSPTDPPREDKFVGGPEEALAILDSLEMQGPEPPDIEIIATGEQFKAPEQGLGLQ